MAQWADRIVGRENVDPATLVPNPANFREHSERQERQLGAVLDQVGWVEDVIVNRTTGHVVDGHLRVSLALAKGEPTVPVAFVELSDDEEQVALAALDRITSMAFTDDAALVGLLDDVGGESAQLVEWLRNEGRALKQPTQEQIDDATDALQNRFSDDGSAGVEVQCPNCGGWFGIAGIGITS